VSTAQLIGIISALFALLATLVGVIFNGLRERIRSLEARDNQAVLLTRVDSLAEALVKLEGRFEQRTKDKDEFDYRFRHGQYVNDINSINLSLLPLVQRVEALDERLDSLHEWKHKVGEAYLPRAVDDHHRRLERIELKVFNGRRENER
jgi:hypothetical protein